MRQIECSNSISFCSLLGHEPDVVELLIERGAFVNALDNDLKSVLYYAIENGMALE